jgi:hypothetical protein
MQTETLDIYDELTLQIDFAHGVAIGFEGAVREEGIEGNKSVAGVMTLIHSHIGRLMEIAQKLEAHARGLKAVA